MTTYKPFTISKDKEPTVDRKLRTLKSKEQSTRTSLKDKNEKEVDQLSQTLQIGGLRTKNQKITIELKN